MTSQQTTDSPSKLDRGLWYADKIREFIEEVRAAGFAVTIDPEENDLDLEYEGVYVTTIEASLPTTVL